MEVLPPPPRGVGGIFTLSHAERTTLVGMMLNNVKSLHRLLVWICLRPLTCSAVLSSDQNHHCLAELRCLPSDLAMQSSYCAEISDFNPCSRLCCPCSIPCSPYSSPCKSRRTCTRSSWGGRMLPTRSWRMLPRRRRKRVTSKFHFLVTGTMELQLNSIVEYTLGCI